MTVMIADLKVNIVKSKRQLRQTSISTVLHLYLPTLIRSAANFWRGNLDIFGESSLIQICSWTIGVGVMLLRDDA